MGVWKENIKTKLPNNDQITFFLSSYLQMKCSAIVIAFLSFTFFAKGQNKPGFDSLVNSLISSKVDTIGTVRLADRLQSEHIILLDARQKEEYDVSHLRGAEYVDYDDFDLSDVAHVPKSKTIVVYCSIGKRSGDIAERLKSAGYEDVFNLYGGIFDWTNRGMEVINDRNESVRCVHPYNSLWGIWINKYDKCYEPR